MDFRNDILPLKNPLYRLALRITLNPQEAEDIVQDTLIKVWNRRDSWDEIESIEAYAMTICRNISLDHVRSKANGSVSLDELSVDNIRGNDDPLQQLSQQENIDRIRSLMDALPEKQRSCMQFRDFEGKSYKEISSVMEISEEQVKISIFRARKYIKEHFLIEK